MTAALARKVALLCPGDPAEPTSSRFAALFQALVAAGVNAEQAVYSNDFADEVTVQLRGVHVLFEINVSSVSPFTRSSIAPLVGAVKVRLSAH